MAGTDERDPYKILQVDPSAEQSMIDAAYKLLARKYHPDMNPGKDTTAQMQDINWARDLLGDPAKRSKYDLERKLRAAKPARPAYPPGTSQPWQSHARTTNAGSAQASASGKAEDSGTGKSSAGSSSSTRGSTAGAASGKGSAGGSAAGKGSTNGPADSAAHGSGARTTGSRTWGAPRSFGGGASDDDDPYRRRYDSTPGWDRPRTPPRSDDRPFARAARGEAPTRESDRGSTSYQQPFERARSGYDNPARPAYGEPSRPSTPPWERAAKAKAEAAARPTGRFSTATGSGRAAAGAGEAARPGGSSASPSTTRPAGTTRRSPVSMPNVPPALVKTLADLSEDRQKLAILGGLVLVAFIMLLGMFATGDDKPGTNSPPPQIAVPYGQTHMYGNWIVIWGEAYRASIQDVVNQAALQTNTAPLQVQLGGYVFADALNRPYGFYCPPTSTYGASMTPVPPASLDVCLPVTLSPALTGYVE